MVQAADRNGLPRYDESDAGATTTFSGILNRLLDWVTAVFDRLPYSEAAGTFAVPALAAGAAKTVDISFPTGRFVVPPILHLESGEARCTIGVNSRTKDAATLVVANLTNAGSGATTGFWTARQMKAAVAAG